MPAGCNRLGGIGQPWLFHHGTFGVIARGTPPVQLTLFAGVCAVAP